MPIEKNESNSPLFASFITMSEVFSNFFTRSTDYAKASYSIALKKNSVDLFQSFLKLP